MTKKEQIVEVQPLNLKRATITIKGKSPLIVNNFNEKSKQQIIDTQMKKAKQKETRNPWEDFIRAFYWLTPMPEEFTEEAFNKAIKEGAKFGFPTKGLKEAITTGAFRNKASKDLVSIRGAFYIPEEFVEIKYDEITFRTDYTRIARGGTDIRFRPEFRNWKATFEIEYLETAYSLEQIVNFINYGGFSCGLGEMRMEKGGNFGSFYVDTTN